MGVVGPTPTEQPNARHAAHAMMSSMLRRVIVVLLLLDGVSNFHPDDGRGQVQLGTARFSRRAHRRFGWRRRAVSGVGRSGAREVLSLPKPTVVLPLRAFEVCSSWCWQQKTGPRAAEPGTVHPTIPEGAGAGRGIAAASHAMKSLLQRMALLMSFHRVSESTLAKDRLPHAGRRNGTAPGVDPKICPSRSTDRVQPQGAEQSLPLFRHVHLLSTLCRKAKWEDQCACSPDGVASPRIPAAVRISKTCSAPFESRDDVRRVV
jgi:hypothetical protein